MSSLQLDQVGKRYGAVEVIANLSLHVQQGEFLVFLGPSGCGKTSLLRMVAGLESVTSGRVLIGGEDVTHRAPGQRKLAMVFQHYALYPHMTVRDNLVFGLRNVGMPTAEIDRRVTEASRMLELDTLLQRKPEQLSGGQRQRVAIGRAVVKEPALFLFDEPLSNLDAALRGRTRVELARLHQRLGATMVFVTHDQLEAMTLATRIVVMNKGAIEQVGTPAEIYRRPATRFVAGFIGTPGMNLLPVERSVDSDSGLCSVTTLDGQRIVTALRSSLVPSGALTLGIRPENLVVAAAGTEPALLQGQVELVEYLGDRSLVHVALASGQTLIATAGASVPARGERVGLAAPVSELQLF
ncbi:ABC transporter ATP-binding protein, partial [Ideonella sp.]|uniref:ABC transporter ATP-binding protein n=1 Tax=Ideonella sp. TaxID=1929293 RepID=UPI003BB60597